MNHMIVVETTPRLKEIEGKTGLFVIDGLQRNPIEERKMLAEIIKEHQENDHSSKIPIVGK